MILPSSSTSNVSPSHQNLTVPSWIPTDEVSAGSIRRNGNFGPLSRMTACWPPWALRATTECGPLA